MLNKITLCFVFLSCLENVFSSTKKPNIIYFLIDDWGYNDVGYYGNTDTETPFIDNLVQEESVRLDKYYVLPECTATRCALLTGRYPARYGMQAGILYYRSSYALTRTEHLLSNEFQDQGYETHLVGKWHLGMMSNDYTPNQRGFDTFLGYYAGLIYYYSHAGIEDMYPNKIDFHWNEEGWEDTDRYTMYTYTDRILNIIDDNVDKRKKQLEAELSGELVEEPKPFFMYVGWQGSHTPSEAPEDYLAKYSDNDLIEDRNYFQAQTTLTDDLLETVVNYLKNDAEIWDNTILIVASDNGAEMGYGDNSPLRGAKFTLWEGGVRVPAFITGGYIPENLRGSAISDVAVHVTDWYPTLLSAADIKQQSPNELDGVDLWDYLQSGGNLQPNGNKQNIKLHNSENSNAVLESITNKQLKEEKKQELNAKPKNENEYENEKENEITNENEKANKVVPEPDAMVPFSNSKINEQANERYILLNANNVDCNAEIGVCGGILYNGRWKLVIGYNGLKSTETGEPEEETCFWHRDFALDTENDQFGCGEYPFDVDTGSCDCNDSPCLFDLENDPCEYINVMTEESEIGKQLLSKLTNYYYNMQVHSLYAKLDAVAPDVAAMGIKDGYWEPWYEKSYDYNGWQYLEFEKKLQKWYIYGVDDDSADDAGSAIHAQDDFIIGKESEGLNEQTKVKLIGLVVIATFAFAILVGVWHLYWNKHKSLNSFDDEDNFNEAQDIVDYSRVNGGQSRYGSVAF